MHNGHIISEIMQFKWIGGLEFRCYIIRLDLYMDNMKQNISGQKSSYLPEIGGSAHTRTPDQQNVKFDSKVT